VRVIRADRVVSDWRQAGADIDLQRVSLDVERACAVVVARHCADLAEFSELAGMLGLDLEAQLPAMTGAAWAHGRRAAREC